MHILDKYADVITLLRGLGYEIQYGTPFGVTLRKPGGEDFYLDEHIGEIFDKRYQQGFKDGFERGAYEAETKEDVEPVKAAAPVTGDWFDLLRQDRGLREWEVNENSIGGRYGATNHHRKKVHGQTFRHQCRIDASRKMTYGAPNAHGVRLL